MRKKIAFVILGCLMAAQITAQEKQAVLLGGTDYNGNQWVKNISKPITISNGLANRHIALWASHGRYYDQEKAQWQWQRPDLFRTTEDLFTQTIVVPYLIPMLENAGATVFTPRERDWQRNEIIIDNDDEKKFPNYLEVNTKKDWTQSKLPGFAQHIGYYIDGENPFTAGTVRQIETIAQQARSSEVSYQPTITEAGRYAVYVSYQTTERSIDDAQYIVYHKGERTEFQVNQRMGAGTWVYLGTFDFDQGCNEYNRVVVTNYSKTSGTVTTDAVRFGGGMGNILRGGTTSGLPRTLEGARYYAQWAGTPYKYYSTKNGQNDYGDDINVRSLMTNWLAGGSIYVPNKEGLNVPIELSLAVHSDAGVAKDRNGIIGSLAICTTNFNDGKLGSGITRQASYDLAKHLLDNTTNDIKAVFGRWNKRYLWDRNYSETRLPEVPSAIIETLSHQNFEDMKFGHDPNFKFILARSLYKTLLQYINGIHGYKYTVQPLPPTQFCIDIKGKNKAKLSWKGVKDPNEKSAKPSYYMVYTAVGSGGFDNGRPLKGTSFTQKMQPGVVYNFKVTAVNKGGESFPTEVLSAACQPGATQKVLVINGFNRLSAPAIVDNDSVRGFDITADPGVSYGRTAGWNADLQGKFIAGNDFNYVTTHAEAINFAQKYNIASASDEAVQEGRIKLKDYDAVDLLWGLEKNDGHSLYMYKTFPQAMQQKLINYLNDRHGRLMVSGAYIGSDMRNEAEQRFLANWLKLRFEGINRGDSINTVTGMGLTTEFYRTLNEYHYAATSTDVISPVEGGFNVLNYSNGTSACVAYQGQDFRTISLGFPFECIIDQQKRNLIMRAMMDFLLK
ncbi:MAG: xanthan lyase [Prevotella sp.]|nr:xanthan lyase [Prevotella sp.]